MDAKTLQALEGSIAKWRAIVDGTGEDKGPRNCPLCQMFNNQLNCVGCPVREATGQKYCDDTPYVLWEDAFDAREQSDEEERSDERRIADTPEIKALAEDELRFLESLRPTSDENPSAREGRG